MITTGILGIRVMNKASRSMYIANMTMAIITANITFAGLVISGIATAVSWFSVTLMALHSIIAILCFAAMVMTITHSALCCSGVCYKNKAATSQVNYVATQNTNTPPLHVQGTNGQLMMITNQQMATQGIPQAVGPNPTPMAYPNSSTPAAQHQTVASYTDRQHHYANRPGFQV